MPIAFLSLLLISVAQPLPDTLRLDELRSAAARQDPRAVQPDLLTRANRLQLAALRAKRLPQLALTGQATVQNEVPEIPIDVPGLDVPAPPHEQFRTQLEADWTLYDGGRIARQEATERARLREEIAGVAVTLYTLREAATEAYFSALLSGARARTLALPIEDLEARLRIVRRQAEEGTALKAEAAGLEAELIRLRQQVEEAEAARRAALRVLAELTGVPIGSSDHLVLPALDADVERTLAMLDEPEGTYGDALLGRPELVRFARAAERAEAEADAREARTRPSVSMFGQAGLGRPSPFNFLADDLSEYGQVGVRLHWSLFDGGRARREAASIRLRARLAETEAHAFERRLMREIEDDRANLDRLDAAIADDRRAVTLREEVLRVTRRQLDEGVVLSDVYTDRLTDFAEARLTLERHRIERAQLQTRLLSTLGRFPAPGEIVGDVPEFE